MIRWILALSTALLVLSCEGPAKQPTPQAPQRIREARGRTTRIDAANAPDTTRIAQAVLVKAPRFTPVENHRAIAHMRTWTTDDGLPMDDIMCGYLDADGMLWFGTNGGGITRYDGRSFTNYAMAHGLPDNVILSLAGDRHGNLWIGTSTGGLCKYDGHVFTPIVLNDATGLARGITSIVEDKEGTLWFGTRGRGVYRYDGTRFTNYTRTEGLGADFVRTMAMAHDGTIWASTLHGVARFAGNGFVEYTEGHGQALSDVEAITSTANGTVWLGHAEGGVTRCDVYGDQVTCYHFPILPSDDVEVTALVPEGTHAIWVGSKNYGAIRFEPRSTEVPRVDRFTVANGMASDEVLCITADRHGDLWFGTRGAGISHYRGQAFTNYSGFKPISIAEDAQGIIHVGTGDGIARLESNGPVEWHPESGFDSWNYSVSADAQGHIGFAENLADLSRSGFSLLDGDTYRVVSVPDRRVDVFWSMHDRRGRLWLAGRRGIERYDEDQRVVYTTGQGIGNNNGLCLFEARDGTIWAGTDGGGLSRIDGTSITTWTTAEGLPNNVVWCVQEDRSGALWIATLGGLSRYDGKSFLTYTTQDGLPDDNINQVFFSKQGDLLIGTLNGLAILTGWEARDKTPLSAITDPWMASNEELQRLRPVFEIHNSSTGFPVKDVQTSEHSVFEDSKGVIWIATGSDKTGLVRFDRKALRKDTDPLTVRLRDVSVNNERVCWYDLGGAQQDSITRAQQEVRVFARVLSNSEREEQRSSYGGLAFSGIRRYASVPEQLVLDHRNNRIGFEFVGIETSRPEVVEYQCMLEGYEEHWSAPTPVNTATYGNIHEGDYVFKVKAKNPSGVWSEPLEYRFTVLPPWHRTWWAYSLYALVVVGGVFLYIRLRVDGLRRQKEKLEIIVAERTEELRHKKEEADEQRSRAELSEKAKEQFLANMSHEIRTPMNAIMGMSDILKNRPHPPEQDKFLNAIAQSSENLLVIINDILDLTKIDAGRIDFEEVPFEPRQVLANVKEILQFKAQEKGLSITLQVAQDVPRTLIGDPTRLNQIVMNLGGNAVKFTEHGSVTIHARCSVDPPSAPLRMGRPEMMVLTIDVTDTGIGIPEDRLEKIFEEFTQAYSDTTRKYGGTGLGLTISRRLAMLQGGSITVKSERDKGSTFTVVVPYKIGEVN